MKQYLTTDVYEEAMNRIAYIFNEFENVYVSFSGGKDSGVLLNLCLDYLRHHDPSRKIGLFHLDYEAQYQMTTDYVDEVFKDTKDVTEQYRICLPISAQCSTSMFQTHWVPWEREKKDIWVRDLPQECVNEDNHTFDFFEKEMWDYDFQAKFGSWYQKHKGGGKTCCLVGIRADESLNRWRAVYSDGNARKYDHKNWINIQGDGMVNAYPIYDWQTRDIWIANARNKWSYNRLYDLYHYAGLSLDQMRVASPFNDCAQNSLKLYRVIDPNNWAKMVGRVNGVNFTAIYGGTTAMGWKNIKLPKGHTWESYMYFLLDTLPIERKESYLAKLSTSIKFWREKGGCLSEDTIDKLRERGVEIEVGETSAYKTSKRPVRMNYLDDIDIAEFKEIPTFKRMCICIMKNDHLCKYMGFSQTKEEVNRRKRVIQKYNDIL